MGIAKEQTTVAQIAQLTSNIERSYEECKLWQDAAEMLWVVLANVSGGDWSKQSNEWQIAAERWRDNYYSLAHKYERKVS